MIYNYSIDGVKVLCKDPEYVTEETVSFRVQQEAYCVVIENISFKVKSSLRKIKWLIERYKCSDEYHNSEKKGSCLDCDNSVFKKINMEIHNVHLNMNILNKDINISKNYSISASESLCNDALDSLIIVKNILLDDYSIKTEAFYLQKTFFEEIAASILSSIGLSIGGAESEISWLVSQVNHINSDLIKLSDILPEEELL